MLNLLRSWHDYYLEWIWILFLLIAYDKSKSEIDTHRDSRELCAAGVGLQGRWDLSSSVDARGSGHWLPAAHLAAPTTQLPSRVGADGRGWICRSAAAPGSQSEAQSRCGGGARHGGGAQRRGGGAEGRREHSSGGRAAFNREQPPADMRRLTDSPGKNRIFYSSLI